MIFFVLLAVLFQPPQVFLTIGWTVGALVCSRKSWRAFWRWYGGTGIVLIVVMFVLNFVPTDDPRGLDYGFVWLTCVFYVALTFPLFGLLAHLTARKCEHVNSQEAPE